MIPSVSWPIMNERPSPARQGPAIGAKEITAAQLVGVVSWIVSRLQRSGGIPWFRTKLPFSQPVAGVGQYSPGIESGLGRNWFKAWIHCLRFELMEGSLASAQTLSDVIRFVDHL